MAASFCQKEKRTSNNATLEVSGRDQPDQKLHLVRNTETLLWELERVETELWKEPPEPLLEKVAGVYHRRQFRVVRFANGACRGTRR